MPREGGGREGRGEKGGEMEYMEREDRVNRREK